MDERNLTLIENKTKVEEKQAKKTLATNPIAKKFVKFKCEKETFCVKELFFK